MKIKKCAAVAVALVATACPNPDPGTGSGPSDAETAEYFQVLDVFTGLDRPTAVAFTDAGRAFVAEKSGIIRAFDSVNSDVSLVVADLRDEVYDHADRGLIGLTVDPLFETTRPYLYALYTYDPPLFGDSPTTQDACQNGAGNGCVTKSQLVRITMDQATMMAVGEPVVLADSWCQQFSSHNIGDVEMGPDGALYASGGDGADFNNIDYGQLTGGLLFNPCDDPPTGNGTLPTPPTAAGGALRSQSAAVPTPGFTAKFNGAVIKIDPDTGDAWPTNPFFGDADADRAKIVGYGFRSPFRIAPWPGSTDLLVSDVGWHDFEEINRLDTVADEAQNHGWPCVEGPGPQPGYEALGLDACQRLYNDPTLLTEPYFVYPRRPEITPNDGCNTGGQAAAGMAFYEGGNYPERYDGLFFSDYGLQCVWHFPLDETGQPDFANGDLMVRGLAATDLTLGPAGDVFLVQHIEGKIVRLVYDENTHPIAKITASAIQGGVPLEVDFDASGSFDPDVSDTLIYEWDLDNDGEYDDGSGLTASTIFTAEGVFSVGLRVTDSNGAIGLASVSIEVGVQYPIPSIDTPVENLEWSSGDPIGFSGSATDAQDGNLGPAALKWEAFVHHCVSDDPGDCHVHPLSTFNGIGSGTLDAPDHAHPSYVELKLTATDSNGNSASVSRNLEPQIVEVQLLSEPAGAQIVLGEESVTAPDSVTLIRNAINTLLTPANQTINGVEHTFVGWSDGGAAQHPIQLTESGTLTAVFAPTSP